jgi:hypothetical protein
MLEFASRYKDDIDPSIILPEVKWLAAEKKA